MPLNGNHEIDIKQRTVKISERLMCKIIPSQKKIICLVVEITLPCKISQVIPRNVRKQYPKRAWTFSINFYDWDKI